MLKIVHTHNPDNKYRLSSTTEIFILVYLSFQIGNAKKPEKESFEAYLPHGNVNREKI